MDAIDTYLVSGLLDAGKTTHISQMIFQDFFHRRERGKTLILACEEGEAEYDVARLREFRTELVLLDAPAQAAPEAVAALLARHQPDRVFWEANAMWGSAELPDCLRRVSAVTLVNGATLDVYFRNMRQLFTDMVRGADLVLFNRAAERAALAPYAHTFRLMNARAGYLWESPLGYHERAFGISLPFDADAPVIELDEEAYSFWYLDALENPARYAGKRLVMTVQAERRAALPGGFFAGRQVMTCCLADIQFLGFPCTSDGGLRLGERAWVRLEALGRVRGTPAGETKLELEPLRVAPCAPPERAVIM